MLPPRIVRRLVLVPLLLLVMLALLVVLPLLAVLAAIASPLLPGRWRAARLLWFGLVWVALESVALVACLALWVASGFGGRLRSEPYQDRHYAIMRWFLGTLYDVASQAFRLRIEIQEPELTPREARARLTRPVIVLSRHAGPGDSFLLVHDLLRRYRRRPRIVMKAALQLDPGVDVMANRLPNAFVSARRSADNLIIREIERLASDLGPTGALVIFPEGGNFTPRRRLRAIRLLEERRLHEEAAKARELEYLLPPKPGLRRPHRPGRAHDHRRHLARPADGAGRQGALVAGARRRGAARAGGAGALAVRMVGADRHLDRREPPGAAAPRPKPRLAGVRGAQA